MAARKGGRPPKPYIHNNWYCTNAGGSRIRLCPVEDGIEAAYAALGKTDIRGVPIQTVVEDFLAFQKANNRKATSEWYEEKLGVLVKFLKNKFLSQVTEADGLRFKVWLREEKPWKKGKKKMKGLSPVTTNMNLRAAKAFFKWAAASKRRKTYYVMENPLEELSLCEEKGRERLLTEEEFNHLMDNCTDGNTAQGATYFRELLIVLRYTAMRPGELRHLRWDYIDWDRHLIEFPATIVKTKRRRVVTMIGVVEEILSHRKEKALARGLPLYGNYVFGLPITHVSKRVAVESSPKMLTKHGIAQRFRRLLNRCINKGLIEKEAEGESLVPYSCRHARCTEMLRDGVPSADVMFAMGHSSLVTTEKYLKYLPSQVVESIREKSNPRSVNLHRDKPKE